MKNLKKNFSLKVGDTVQIIAGNDKGKTGKILAIIKKKNRIVIDGINKRIKHITSNKKTKTSGTIKEINAPLDISNVMFWDSNNNLASKIGYTFINNKKVRYLKKTKEIIDIKEKKLN